MISDETLQLLRAIYQGQREGYLTLTTIHPNKKQRTPSRHLHVTDHAGIHQALADLMRTNQMGWGAYFSVALRKEPLGRWHRGGQSDLLTLTALFADLDGDLSESFERIRKSGLAGMPSASAMIGSGRGLHLYWFIEPTEDFDLANRVLIGLAKQLGGDALTVHNAMRLPGSHNSKVSVNRPCRLLWLADDHRYTLSDFEAFAELPTPSDDRWRAPPPDLPDQINPDLVTAVVDVLMRDYDGFVQPNAWIGSLCPVGHAADRPGKHFAFNPKSACGVCFGRHARLLLKDLCQLLGLDPADYGGLYRKEKVERKTSMARKKSKTKETVILIRIPDANARQGEATLTIQRGDLGHMQSFAHTGLSLKSDVAETVQDALQKLATIEAAPPPELPAKTDENETETVSSQTDSSQPTDDSQSVSTASGDSASESADSRENDADSPENAGVSSPTVITDTDDTLTGNPVEDAENPPEKVSVSVMASPTDTSGEAQAENQQISLF